MIRTNGAHFKRSGLRRLGFVALRFTLLPFLLREVFHRRKVAIVVYHAPAPDVFDAHLSLLKRLYNIVALSDFLAARRTGGAVRLPAKALIITLDDGHRSNYALKAVIQKHDVPVTIFVCSGIVGTRRRFWFLHSATASVVQQLKAVSDIERLQVLCSTGFEETREFEERQALSDSELEELRARVDIQSHTVFHPILPRCQSVRAEAEIVDSKRDLETRLGSTVYAFAYPNGSYGNREVDLVQKAGYACALTLDRGLNSNATPLLKLRRIALRDNTDQHELLVKASGLWGYIKTILHSGRRCELRMVGLDNNEQIDAQRMELGR